MFKPFKSVVCVTFFSWWLPKQTSPSAVFQSCLFGVKEFVLKYEFVENIFCLSFLHTSPSSSRVSGSECSVWVSALGPLESHSGSRGRSEGDKTSQLGSTTGVRASFEVTWEQEENPSVSWLTRRDADKNTSNDNTPQPTRHLLCW